MATATKTKKNTRKKAAAKKATKKKSRRVAEVEDAEEEEVDDLDDLIDDEAEAADDLDLDDLDDEEEDDADESDDEEEEESDEEDADDADEESADEESADEEDAEEEDAEAEDGEDSEYEYAVGHDVVDIPLDDIKPGKARSVDEGAVGMIAKSIRQVGLINPIVIGADNVVIAGNHRLAAYRKLGRAKIPCRYMLDKKTGEAMTSAEANAAIATVAENLNRRELNPVDEARQFSQLIKSGAATNEADLAKLLGVSRSTVTRAMLIANKSSKRVREALEDGTILADAARNIINKAEDEEQQDALLDTLVRASEGKRITTKQVAAATSGKPAKKNKAKGGRKPSVATCDPTVTATDETGVTVRIRMDRDNGNALSVDIAINDIEVSGKTFRRFDVNKSIREALNTIDAAALKSEMEAQRQALLDA